MSQTVIDCVLSDSDDAAPLGSARHYPAVLNSLPGRFRRQGPRSQLSRLRRSVPKHCRTLPGACLGESRHSVPDQSLSNFPQLDLKNDSNSENKISGSNLKNTSKSEEVSDKTSRDCNFRLSRDQNGLLILLFNIQCLLARIPELCHHLEEHQPHVVCIQETWLDKSTKNIHIPGYVVV